MRLSKFLSFLLLSVVGWIFSASADQQPNLLLILADDMGYGDLSCLGSQTVSTPYLDALAESGVLCTQAYVASAVCSPSRAAMMTGRDPRRFGYEGNLNNEPGNYSSRAELLGLPVQEHTLADQLKPLGYETALVGKWHLGEGKQFHPNQRGFDYFCGMPGGGHDYFPRDEENKIERNGEPVRSFSSPYLTDFFTDEAVRWIVKSRDRQTVKPWFLYLSYNAPHTPMQATAEDLAACQHVKDPNRRTYAAMMRALDRGIGRVMKSLQETGQRESTLVVFLSDNGGATNNASWNGPLSGAKGSLREGGVRVPMIWSWPRHFTPRQLDDQLISSLDLLPTFLAAAGGVPLALENAPSYHDLRNQKRGIEMFGEYDGINLLPMLSGQDEHPSRKLFWRLQGQAAIRSSDIKLIRLSHRPAQLFQIADDIGEQNDLALDKSEELKRLYKELAEWEAMLPTVPIWDSSPYWYGDSANIYDTWHPREEPR